MREIVWKLADRTFVFADGRGFSEMALPGLYPGGVLRWCARMLMTTGLVDFVWWIPYLLLGAVLGLALHGLVLGWRRWRLLPAWIAGGILFAYAPLLCVNDRVWSVTEPAFPMTSLLGALVVCGACWVVRAGFRRGNGWGGAAGVTVAALVVPCGLAAPMGALIGVVAGGLRARRWWVGTIVAAVQLAALPIACSWVYADLAWKLAATRAFPFPRSWGAREGVVQTLRMERLARREDWRGILDAAEDARTAQRDFPGRMEIAYRILAQYRIGRLPEGLFRYPIRTDHATTDALQRDMDGYVLLFNYGFLLPARRQIFERECQQEWEPGHFRYLGDISAIRGETSLAYRAYVSLRRCPFRRAFAERRLAALDGSYPDGFADLQPIAADAEVWQRWWQRQNWKFFRMSQQVEDFIYQTFLDLKEAPENMVRMYLAAVLLCRRPDLLAENVPLLDRLYPPPAPWPVAVQEAFPWGQTPQVSGGQTPRTSALAPRTLARRRQWEAEWRRIGASATPADKERLRHDFGDTYWFYDWWVR